MTFKKGFYVGIFLGLILIIAGGFFVNKLKNDAESLGDIALNDLRYTNLEGKEVSLSDYSEDKNVLINFWATWCVPCVKEFPLLNAVYKLVEDDFVFIVVSDESIEKINEFISTNQYDFTFLKTEKFLLNGITSIPQTFVLDENLEKVKYHPSIFEGEASIVADSLRQWIE